ncbi:MAG: ATP-dependent helicase/nuclease subunit A [Myxococcota bacterium]|jgi:ATP-dependent helicase/nuclease subunit A
MTAVDQGVRDRADRELSFSIALSAGAGSGKTRVLTARVVALLASGVQPGRIAAVTFTEKAAGELQERVRDAVEARLAAGATPTLEQALAALPELTLSTIHSFCRQLLTSEALAAGWAPDTEILPDIIAAPEVASAYNAWEVSFRERHDAAGLVLRQLVNPITLREAALRLLAYRDLEPVLDPLAFHPERAFAGLQECQARLDDAATACSAPATDKLLSANAALRGLLARAVAQAPAEGVARALSGGMGGGLNRGRNGDWIGDGKHRFVESVEHYRAWRGSQLAALHGLVVQDLITHFVPAVAAAKAHAAVADYDDLLFRAAELLGDPDARARLAGRFDAVLIDEVQDTDPIQAEVAALLTRPPAAEGGWTDHPPRPGHLFAVGDPCQSIFRFRRADVATWSELRELVERRGVSLSLEQNFRSVPGIVAWVNAAFADLPGYSPQAAYRPAATLEPVIRLQCDPEEELDLVARALHHTISTGQVVDRETHALRAATWSDVMVLLPTWTQAEAVRSTLARAGIPCAVEGGGAFFLRDEVRACIAALRCIDEPGDPQSTVLTLRSLFGLDWATLAEHRADVGTWRCTVPDPPPGPVADAYAVLRALSRQRGRRPWAVLLDAVLERSHAAAVWAALQDAEARLSNVDKLRAILRQLDATARSPSEVLDRLADLDRDKDLSGVDLDNDSVRITSYFKAKGLEAPIVVLCAARRRVDPVTGTPVRSRSRWVSWCRATGRPARTVSARRRPMSATGGCMWPRPGPGISSCWWTPARACSPTTSPTV